MRSSEIERLLTHLDAVGGSHPVATAVDAQGATVSGDVTYVGATDIVVCEPVTKQPSQIHLATAVAVRVAALGRVTETFGDAANDDETVVP